MYETIDTIRQDYVVDEERWVIRSPGKFEGEPVFAPYFYDLMLNGCADDTLYDDRRYPGIGAVDVFDVTSLDQERFPSLRGVEHVYLYTDDQGFVHCETTER